VATWAPCRIGARLPACRNDELGRSVRTSAWGVVKSHRNAAGTVGMFEGGGAMSAADSDGRYASREPASSPSPDQKKGDRPTARATRAPRRQGHLPHRDLPELADVVLPASAAWAERRGSGTAPFRSPGQRGPQGVEDTGRGPRDDLWIIGGNSPAEWAPTRLDRPPRDVLERDRSLSPVHGGWSYKRSRSSVAAVAC